MDNDNDMDNKYIEELTRILLNHKNVLNNFKILTQEYFFYIDINQKITNPDYCRVYYNIFNLFSDNSYRIQSILFKNHRSLKFFLRTSVSPTLIKFRHETMLYHFPLLTT